MSKWLQDVESRGKVAFNTNCITSHAEAEKYAKKKYMAVIEQDCFVAGWNMAYWDKQSDDLKKSKTNH